MSHQAYSLAVKYGLCQQGGDRHLILAIDVRRNILTHLSSVTALRPPHTAPAPPNFKTGSGGPGGFVGFVGGWCGVFHLAPRVLPPASRKTFDTESRKPPCNIGTVISSCQNQWSHVSTVISSAYSPTQLLMSFVVPPMKRLAHRVT
ncbi:hypothetical protein E2C01_001230 [Portunus trituberculatus]|uniref:Uncharacterized protein n=1 Tax=Portunus trituberculatus TaxID=210409 RepID=A0A5B7CH42_PORTR|nr:hypothetical protein [Portunus trituberculatus]